MSVAELKSLLADQPKSPLRPEQVSEYQEELRRLGAVADGRDQEGVQRPWMPGDRGLARQSIQRIRRTLNDQAPRPLDGAKKDRVAKLVKDTIDTAIRPALLPTTVMRRNPAGAVGQFMRGEMSRPIKDAILTVKRGLRALEPDNADPDYANMERFRPSGERPDGAPTFMAEAQIPGVFAMTPAAKEQWPLGEPTVNTPLKQARAKSAAQLAALARGRAKRAAKLASQNPPGDAA